MQMLFLKNIIKVIVYALLLLSMPVDAKNYQTETVITGVDVPWGMVQLPDQNFLITDRSGTLYYADINTGRKTVIKG